MGVKQIVFVYLNVLKIKKYDWKNLHKISLQCFFLPYLPNQYFLWQLDIMLCNLGEPALQEAKMG